MARAMTGQAAGAGTPILAHVLLALVVAGFTLLALTSPLLFQSAMQEDAWAEWATFFSFLLAAGLFATAAIRRAADGWLLRLCAAGLALGCLVIAAEEISWGQRLAAFQPPETFLAENFQLELNAHNVLKERYVLGIELKSRYLVAALAFGYGVLAPFLLWLTAGLGWLRQLKTCFPGLSMTPWFGLVVITALWYPVSFVGETFELFLGLLFAQAGLRAAGIGVLSPRAAAAVIALPFAAGIVTPPILDRIFIATGGARAEAARQELEALLVQLRLDSIADHRLYRKRSVHKRLYTAVQDRYFSAPAETDADDLRQAYYLDPWNNAYWICYRRGQYAILYSFGPNRRRDSQMKTPLVVEGDDILVYWTPPRR